MKFIVKEENGKRVGQIVDISQQDANEMVGYVQEYVNRFEKQFDNQMRVHEREVLIYFIEASSATLEKFDKFYWQIEGEVDLDEAQGI